jgi:hypothetical protein
MRQAEVGITIVHLDARVHERFSTLFIVVLSITAGGIEHHSDLHAAMLSGNHRLE